MQWTYQGKIVEQISEEYVGFVYLITNLTNDKKYIGKKLAQFKVTKKPLKGKRTKGVQQRKVIGETIGDPVTH